MSPQMSSPPPQMSFQMSFPPPQMSSQMSSPPQMSFPPLQMSLLPKPPHGLQRYIPIYALCLRTMSSVPFVLIRNDKQVSDCGLQVLLDPVHKGQQEGQHEGQCNFPQQTVISPPPPPLPPPPPKKNKKNKHSRAKHLQKKK